MGKGVRSTTAAALAVVAAFTGAAAGPDKPARKVKADPAGYRFSMTRAVVCLSVAGYEDFVERPAAALTADEKLILYYRPRHFASEFKDGEYRADLIQDARIRRRGKKPILQSKDKLVEYVPKGPAPLEHAYITNWISVSDLKPGDYDLEIILHDVIAETPAITQTVPFTIIPDPAEAKP